MKLPLAPLAVFNLVRELRASTAKEAPLVLGGAPLLVEALRRELLRDGDPSAVRDASLGALEGAAALVYVLGGEVGEEDERALRAAEVAGVPAIVLGPDPRTPIPYVLATDVLPLRAGEGFPLDELARLLGAKVARQNGMVGAAVFIPGVDFPVLTINQLRLVLRLAAAYGQQLDAQRLPEILGVVGTALGFRAVARQALGVVPVAGWAVKGGVAYTGTRAVGEAAIRYFEARAASGGGGAEPGAAGADRT